MNGDVVDAEVVEASAGGAGASPPRPAAVPWIAAVLSGTEPPMALLNPGDPAPDLEARTADGRVVRLSELRGRFVLVYFYPKDSTPGCTTEACSLNRSLDELGECGADIIGVSIDSWESHARFAGK